MLIVLSGPDDTQLDACAALTGAGFTVTSTEYRHNLPDIPESDGVVT